MTVACQRRAGSGAQGRTGRGPLRGMRGRVATFMRRQHGECSVAIPTRRCRWSRGRVLLTQTRIDGARVCETVTRRHMLKRYTPCYHRLKLCLYLRRSKVRHRWTGHRPLIYCFTLHGCLAEYEYNAPAACKPEHHCEIGHAVRHWQGQYSRTAAHHRFKDNRIRGGNNACANGTFGGHSLRRQAQQRL